MADVKGASASDRDQVVAYDYRRPNRISKDRMRTIRAIFDRLESSFALILQQSMRSAVEVKLEDLSENTFGEYANHLGKPCSAFVYRLGDAEENGALFDFGQRIPFQVIDRIFGGHGSEYAINRAMSKVEQNAFQQQVADRMMGAFTDAWQEHISFEPTYKHFEATPEVLEMALREDPVLIAAYRIQYGGQSTTFSFCLPIAAIENFLSLSTTGRVTTAARNRQRVSPEERRGMEANLRQSVVELSVRLPTFVMTARAISAARPGMLLHTGVRIDAHADVHAGSRVYFRGERQREGERLALRVVDSVASAEEAISPMPSGRLLPANAEGESVVIPPIGSESAGSAAADVQLPVIVEVGRTQIALSQMASLKRSALLQLDRFDVDACDVYFAGRRVLRGRFVEVGEFVAIAVSERIAPAQGGEATLDIEGLEALTLPVTVEAGTAWLPVSQILWLARGAMLDLDRGSGAHADLRLPGRKVATAEIVQVGEYFAARVSEVRDEDPRNRLEDTQPAEFMPLDPAESTLASLADLVLPARVEIGRRFMTLAEVARLAVGDVIELDRFAGEPCDLVVGGRRVAEGEIVLVADRFIFKVTNPVALRLPTPAVS